MARTAKAVPTTRGRASGFNQQKMIDLWNKGKSIVDIANSVGASSVWTRRVIATKAPEAYNKGLDLRHAQGAQARSTASADGRRSGSDNMSDEQVNVIARAVASAMFSDAQLVPQPVTRTEMFDNISKGVREGVRKASFGFHS